MRASKELTTKDLDLLIKEGRKTTSELQKAAFFAHWQTELLKIAKNKLKNGKVVYGSDIGHCTVNLKFHSVDNKEFVN